MLLCMRVCARVRVHLCVPLCTRARVLVFASVCALSLANCVTSVTAMLTLVIPAPPETLSLLICMFWSFLWHTGTVIWWRQTLECSIKQS